tara:strand:+ start:1711 stop:2961 length:1251 start_codon:yes stop_codon:yes gene_type:complete
MSTKGRLISMLVHYKDNALDSNAPITMKVNTVLNNYDFSPNTKVAVAMSGGVDSSVAAAILAKSGVDVIGITMDIWPDGAGQPGPRNCCSPESVADAKEVCALLGIEHILIDMKEPFANSVVDRFAKDYFDGLTPNPCIDCNQHIKYGALDEHVMNTGATVMATGHYARKQFDDVSGKWQLFRGIDSDKDQSYVLYNLDQARLSRALFPIGGLTKDEVRSIAHDLGLPIAEKPESMDICFVADDYREFARKWSGKTSRPGPILSTRGTHLGTHTGIENYTVGQRKGLGVSSDQPLYVTKIDPVSNSITVGTREDTLAFQFPINQVNSISGNKFIDQQRVQVKIRSHGKLNDGVILCENHSAEPIRIELEEPVWAIAPGQAAVIYAGEMVLGGGRIGTNTSIWESKPSDYVTAAKSI